MRAVRWQAALRWGFAVVGCVVLAACVARIDLARHALAFPFSKAMAKQAVEIRNGKDEIDPAIYVTKYLVSAATTWGGLRAKLALGEEALVESYNCTNPGAKKQVNDIAHLELATGTEICVVLHAGRGACENAKPLASGGVCAVPNGATR